jgi:hypothetical protein
MFVRLDARQNDRLTQDRQQYSSPESRGGRFHPTMTRCPNPCCGRLLPFLLRLCRAVLSRRSIRNFHPNCKGRPRQQQALLPRERQRRNCDPVQTSVSSSNVPILDARQKRLGLLRIDSNGLVYSKHSRTSGSLKVFFDVVGPIEGLGRAEDDSLSIDRGVLAGMFFRAELRGCCRGLVAGSNGQLECSTRRSTER